MCRAVRCKTCGRTTWAGCGQHVGQVKAGVPAKDWCNGQHTAAEDPRQEAAARAAGGLLGCGVLAVAPVLRRDTGLDLTDVLAAAGPGGLAAGRAADGSAHGSSFIRAGR